MAEHDHTEPAGSGELKLYVCWGTFGHPGGHVHPCRHAYQALTAAGHRPRVIRSYGWRHLPDVPFNLSRGRRAAKRLAGSSAVPVLVPADGGAVAGSKAIADWARAHPATPRAQLRPDLEVLRRPGVEHAGDRPRLLFLHGLWHAAWAWENWLEFFSQNGYDVIAPSLPGYGASPGNYRAGNLAKHLALVRGLIEEAGRAPVLFGHSYGGFLIQHLLAERTFPAAVLVASAPHRYPSSIGVRATLRHPRLMMRSVAARDLTCLVETPALAREVFFGPDTPQEMIVTAQPRLKGAPLRAFIDMRVRVARRPLAGTPTLVLAGAHDRNFTIALERRIAERLGGELMVVENSGHDIPLDLEWRVAAERVVAWLDSAATIRRGAPRGVGEARAIPASDGAG